MEEMPLGRLLESIPTQNPDDKLLISIIDYLCCTSKDIKACEFLVSAMLAWTVERGFIEATSEETDRNNA